MLRSAVITFVCLSAVLAYAQDAAPLVDDLAKQAEAAYQAKQYSKSAHLYLQALPLVQDSDRAGVEYNLACAHTLKGDSAAALNTLSRAVEDSYSDRKDTEADKYLIALHSDPHWQPLLDQISHLGAQQEQRWGDSAFISPHAGNLSDEDKLAGLSELWAKAYREYIPKVLATHSTSDYYRVLQTFYVQLQDGHTGVYSPDQIEGKLSRLPLRNRLVDDHLLSIGSRFSAADVQGLRAGDEIVTINSEPATTWAKQNVAPFVSASTSQVRDNRTFESLLFLAPIGTTFKLGIQTTSGTRSIHTFEVAKSRAPHLLLFDMKVLPGNTAYVALNGFNDDTAAKEWDKHWPEISRANSLILYLRENGGGDDSGGDHILSTLVDNVTPGELSRSTRWIATYRAWGNAETPVRFLVGTLEPDPTHRFAGPTILLTSPRTFSAGEDMVVIFAQAHPATSSVTDRR